MEKPTAFVAKKLANALFPNAEPSFGAVLFGGRRMKRLSTRQYGGLWVGGTVYLLADALVFYPNGLNRAMHEGDVSRHLPLAEVASVTDQSGWFTRIVTIVLKDGAEFRFRCYGAREFARLIQNQMSARTVS